MPGIRVIGETVPCESTIIADIEEGVAAAMKDAVDALVRPLTAEEKSPKQQTGRAQGLLLRGHFRR
jgi:hypothetical protein